MTVQARHLRTIQRLIVRPSVRQVDAHEAAAGRYIGFTLLVVLALVGIYTGDWTPQTKYPMASFAVFLSLLLFRPWHRLLRVDMDAVTLTFWWRLLGVLPIYRRTLELDGKQLSVETMGVTHSGKTAEQQVGSGCLMLALPFPVSAFLWLLGGGEKERKEQTMLFQALCLANPEGDRIFAEVTQLVSASVADEFFEAVREILPENVQPVLSIGLDADALEGAPSDLR